MTLTVIQDVQEGDELLICYSNGTPACLYEKYGFACRCGGCAGMTEEEIKQFERLKWQ